MEAGDLSITIMPSIGSTVVVVQVKLNVTVRIGRLVDSDRHLPDITLIVFTVSNRASRRTKQMLSLELCITKPTCITRPIVKIGPSLETKRDQARFGI